MIQPILAYAHNILRQKCIDIEKGYSGLYQLIADMWETMENASGCGLAAPQIGLPVKLFVVDSKTTFEHTKEAEKEMYFEKDDKGVVETFINARIIERAGHVWEDEEGCLSIPGLLQPVKRHWIITIEYYNQHFERRKRTFSGMTARMIQHEYDHTEGVLYLDYLKPLTRKIMESKLKKVMKGQIHPKYPMKFM